MVAVGDTVVLKGASDFDGLRGVVIEDDSNSSEELKDWGLVLISPLDIRPDGMHGPFYWNENDLEVVGNERDNPLNLG